MIAALAKKVQVINQAQPLSMFTLFQQEEVDVTPEERHLRGRATELGQLYDCDKLTKDAIIEIGQTLQLEGLEDMPEGCELKSVLQDQSGEQYEDQTGKIILAYHYMLWRTASHQSCTLPRSCGESFMSPYLPLILEATQMPLKAKTVFSGENRGDQNDAMKSDMAEYLQDLECDPENWTEISILDFFHACLPAECQVKKLTSRGTAQVVTCRDTNLTWREARDSDNLKGEEIYSTVEDKLYVRSDGDLRKLYEALPPHLRLKGLTLGQFASEYARVHPSWTGYESAKSKISEETQIGPLTGRKLAGAENEFLPQSIMLTNGIIMRIREEQVALVQLYTGLTTRYSSQLLWSPWQQLEEVSGEQDLIETGGQRSSRLTVFPMSTITEDDF